MNPFSDFKSEIKLFLIVATVSTVLAVAGIFLLQAGLNLVKPAPAPLSFPQPQALEGWQTYRNSEFGFEVKHPSDWVVEEYDPATESVSNANHVDFTDDTDNNLTYTFRFGFIVYVNPNKIPLREYLVQERINVLYPLMYDIALPREERQGLVSALNDTIFHGYEALQNEQNTKLFVSAGQNVVMLYMDSLVEGVNSFADPPFNQILSTFRFLDE